MFKLKNCQAGDFVVELRHEFIGGYGQNTTGHEENQRLIPFEFEIQLAMK